MERPPMASTANGLPSWGTNMPSPLVLSDYSTSTPSPPHTIANPALLFDGRPYNSTGQYSSQYYGNISTCVHHQNCTTDIRQHVDSLFMADPGLRKVAERYPELLLKISQAIDNVVSWELNHTPYMNRLDRANMLFREITASAYHPFVVCAYKAPPVRVQNDTIGLFLLQCRQELFAHIFNWVDLGHDTHHLLQRMLSWIHLSKRPLSARELQEAMRFSLSGCQPPLQSCFTFQELNFLGGEFIQFREATNEVIVPESIKQSIKKYFVEYGLDYGGYYDRMGLVCLDYIQSTIGFSSPCPDDIFSERRHQVFPLLAYAIENWHYNFRPTTDNMEKAVKYLHDDSIIRTMMHIQRKIQFESHPNGVSNQQLSQRHHWNTTRLNYAVSIGNYHLVEAFLICGCNPNGEADHQPPLISAVMNRHSNIVQLLVGCGANVNIVDFANRTPLYLAVSQNDFATVQYLSTCARGTLNLQNKMTDKMTPLMAAICNGNLQIAEALLSAEPQVYLQACDGQTALSYALPKPEFWKLAIRMFELGLRKETWTSQTTADITLYEGLIEITDRAGCDQVTACLWRIDEILRTQGPSVDYETWTKSFVRKFLDQVTADGDLSALKNAVAVERRKLKMMLPLGNNLRQKYMLRRAVGAGAFSAAWEAIDLVERKLVAVKFLLDPKNTRNCDDAVKERKFMRDMNHPNILKCLDDMTIQGVPVNITEFASQGDLYHYLSKHCRYGLPDSIAKIMFRQIMEGLVYLHARDVVHRDLKSLNILVFENNLVKIADFGNSKQIPAEDYGYVHHVPCTPTHIAPEAIDDEEASEEWILAKPCDVYSAGVCLYEMLAGKEPFNTPGGERDSRELHRQIREGDLRFDDYIMWGTHDDLAMHLLARMMNLDPQKRPTAEQVLTHPWLTPNAARRRMLDTFALREPHFRKPATFNAHRPEWITPPPRTRRGDHSYSQGLEEEADLFTPPSRRRRADADASLSQELDDFRQEYDFSVHPPRLGH